MADKAMTPDAAASVPLKYVNDENEPKTDIEPPAYQNPQHEFSDGWKDVGFAIAFWIHVAVVIVLGCVLGLPIAISNLKGISLDKTEQTPSNFDIKSIGLSLGGAATAGGLVSFLILFILQLCAGHFIKCAFFLFVMLYVLLGVALFFIFPPLAIIPALPLAFILIYIGCVRKRISFSEAHLQAGCESLRSHPSLILMAIFMLIVEFIWFIFWSLMLMGVLTILNKNQAPTNLTAIDNGTTVTSYYATTTTQASWLIKTTSAMNQKGKPVNGTPFWMQEQGKKNSSSSILDRLKDASNKKNSTSTNEKSNVGWTYKIVMFFLLLSWYWGAITFGNIIHFMSACAVGDWWFGNDNGNGKYTIGNSFKRAFTTSMGTIAFGSLFEAIIKALRACTRDERRKSLIACLIDCILSMIEKVIGYMNEWAFTFAALTGQGFIQASKSFFELFKKRGWTAIINDSIVGMTLGLINFVVGLISAFVGGYLLYLLMAASDDRIFFIIMVAFISFLIGLFLSSIITTLLTSCVRTVFVCFALHPAALGATHPDHLQKLTKVWHKFYPQEFANSGYASEFKEAPMV